MFRNFILPILFNTMVIGLFGQNFRFIDLPLKDICYSVTNDKLYGVLAGNSAQGNAFLVINPNTGAIEKRVEVGSEPSHIKISDSGRILHIALFGAPYLQRYDLSLNQFLPITHLEKSEPTTHVPLNTLDMALMPNSETSLVIARMFRGQTPRIYDLVVFDNTQLREQNQRFTTQGNKLVLMEDGQTLWGLGHDYFPMPFKRYRVTSQRVEEVENYPGLINAEVTHVAYQNKRMYLQSGQIFDVSGSGEPQLLTTLDIGQNYNKTVAPLVPALDSNHIYFVSDLNPNLIHGDRYRGSFIKRVDKTTFQRLDSVFIPAPGWFWNGESTKKILSLGKGRIALLSEFEGHPRLMLYSAQPCNPIQLDLTITPGRESAVCIGDSIELSAMPGYTDYYWSNGMIGPKIKLSNKWGGKDTIRYQVIGPNGCLSERSAVAVVSFSPKPTELQVYSEANRNVICPNEKAVLKTLADRAAYTFIWSTGDTLLPGQNLVVDSGGIYTVWARGIYGCLSDPKTIEILEANPGARVKPVVRVDGPLSYCNNNLTELRGPEGAFAYEWSDGKTAQAIKPTISGPYALRLRYSNGCIGPWSDTFEVKVSYRATDALQLVQQFEQIRIDNSFFLADSVRWFFNGTPFSNPNRGFYFPKENGFYSVQAYWQGCPGEPSVPFVFPQAIQLTLNSFPNNDQRNSYLLFPNVTPIDNYRLKWSDGSTTPSIEVKAPGTYCLTLYRDWARDSASACVSFADEGQLQIESIAADGPVQGMPVVLYQYLNPAFKVIDTIDTDLQGISLFKNLRNGLYYAQAVPRVGTPQAKLYLPTYARSATLWGNATPFQMKGLYASNTTPEKQQILLQTAQMLMGEGTISGFIQSAGGFAPGNPSGFVGADVQNVGLANVNLVLYDASGKIIASTYSDGNGYYVFNNVPIGTYTLSINLLGVLPVSQTVNITSNQPTASNISFQLKGGSFVIVGTKNIEVVTIDIWPNPITGVFYCTIPEKCRFFIYDVIGRLVAQGQYTEGVKEEHTLATQPSGVYFLKIHTLSGKTGLKRIVKH